MEIQKTQNFILLVHCLLCYWNFYEKYIQEKVKAVWILWHFNAKHWKLFCKQYIKKLQLRKVSFYFMSFKLEGKIAT